MPTAAEAEIAALTAQLAQAQRELHDLYYAIGHDLRAPLRVLTGFTQALREHNGPASETSAQHFLQRIEQASQQLSAMVEGLLQLSRLNQTELQPVYVDVTQLSTELAAELAARYSAHEPQFTVDAGLKLYGDVTLLRAALQALLDNAWKFTQGRAAAQIKVSATHVPGWQTLCVHDNGMGIDMNYAHRLFVPFQHLQARVDLNGVGLGLSRVQRIITRHGGTIRVEAALNEFTAFYVTLPHPAASQ